MVENDQIHIVPSNDLKEHITTIACWCSPVQDEIDLNLWVHNSADGREHTLEKGKIQ